MRKKGKKEEVQQRERDKIDKEGKTPQAGRHRQEEVSAGLREDRRAVESGGADKAAGGTSRFEKAGLLLGERIMSVLSSNSLHKLSLVEVGHVLLRCLEDHCKPLSTAHEVEALSSNVTSWASTAAERSHLEIWERLVLQGLTWLADEADTTSSDFFRDPLWQKSVREQLERFDIWHESIEETNFEKYFTSRSVDYAGEEVKIALELCWEAVSNSLPEGVGRLDLSDFCCLGTKTYVENFESFLVPEELQVRLRPPRVMCVEGGWDELCKGLIAKNICSVVPITNLYHIDGKPLPNGLFAVGKGEYVGSLETQRLIMNLTPVNAICRELRGDIATLPSLSNMNLMMLGPGQQCLVSSEDVRCFFYLFRVPQHWKRYLGFNKLVPPHLIPQKFKGMDCVLSSNVLPMGFCNSVSIAQHIHRVVINKSNSLMKTPVMGEGEIRRDRGFPRKDDRYRVYLDNFDQLEVVDSALANVLKGSTSDQVQALRESYSNLGLPRHEKKAVSRELRAEVQGALLLGDKGIAVAKPQKILQYVALTLALLQRGEGKLRELQVVAGGLVYLTSFRKPLLGSLNEIWIFIETLKKFPPVVRLPLPGKVVFELLRFLCLVPLAQMSFTPRVEGMVTCSDASMEGGGICRSLGLTSYGYTASGAPVRGDIPEEHDFVQVLSVGLFDGISGLRVACDALNLPMAGHISIESDPLGRRVVESFFPDTVFHDDVTTVTDDMVKGFSLRFSNAGVVLIGAGPPCQGVSKLNSDRRGALKDHRSCLFKEVPRIVSLFKKHFVWAQVQNLMESVASMSDHDRYLMSSEIALEPWKIDSKGLTLCRRPRLYWVTWELLQQEGVTFAEKEGEVREVVFDSVVNAKDSLEPGWSMAGDYLPTFTTARPSPVPGRKPAGLHTLTAEEEEKWKQDWHRFPPYQYAFKCGVVNKKQEWRLPSVSEREINMGFPLNYTKACVVKSQQKGWDFENARMTLLGNSWQVGVITWLLGCLFFPLGLCPALSPKDVIARLSPGQGASFQGILLRPPMGPQRALPPEGHESLLVKKMLGIVSTKGEDLLLQSSSENTVKFHRLRASVPSRLWKWRDVAGWKWKGSGEHINQLELRAVHTTIKWWVKKKRATSVRFLHLVDSLVGLHSLSRGRTSSRKLRRTVMRINSLVLGADLHPLWGYVHTSQNPADRPSRRGTRFRKKWVK